MNARVLIVAAALLAPAPARAEEAPRTRVAHVGLQLDGGWSFLAHELQEPNAVLVAVAEPVAELRDRARAKVGPGVPIFDDYVRMLDEVKPEAVVATLPNAEHLALVRACARRRVHVWLQKPMATSARDAREMQRLAEQAGVTLMINYFRLWAPPVQALADRVARGDLGTIQRVVVQEGYGPEHEKKMSRHYLGYFWKPELQGGGSLIEQGTYGLHWAVWLLGRPARVWATAKKLRRDAPFTAEDESWTVLDYPGATAISQGSWSAPDSVPGGTSGIQIVGTRGVARMAGGRWTISVAGGPAEPQPLEGPEPPPERRNGVAHFVDCIRHRRPVDRAHGAALNVLVSEVTEAAYQSIRTGAPVRFP